MTTRKAAAPRTRTKAGQATKKTSGTSKRVTARTVQRTERGTSAPRQQEPQERHPSAADYFAVGLVLLFIVLVGGGSTAREVLRSAVVTPPAQFQTQPAPTPAGGQP